MRNRRPRSRPRERPCDLSSRASTVPSFSLYLSHSVSVSPEQRQLCIIHNDDDDNNSNNNHNNNNNNSKNRSQCFYEPCSVSVPHPNAGNFKCVYGPLVLIGQRSLLSSSSSSPSPITPDASAARCFYYYYRYYYFHRYRRCTGITILYVY